MNHFFIGCQVALFLGWLLAKRPHLHGTDKAMAMWHLTNGFFWSLYCDSLSGLFVVMPRMRELSLVMDVSHLNHELRASLDACYWGEFLVHVPFSLLCFYG